ncbi:hypothetical protein EIN_192820 [Entamoeba invadens IP1]|uniref:Right handed beta helix domain-containing protein n=1 Tax=Entamoeba invadens IP1 TaxID=370355 RepID=A0A0A1U9G0_ENTIV|nr:hypothetical protein EIN_192820 [Entamoeba invadens IP1]ELP88673.1 hypothetical protein EIN_192820 [Entamoeba invadens IP1]|eukprot:XP_004255444.1 hypothetical protein EIN_192820 [Entamoeba invadens IP1]
MFKQTLLLSFILALTASKTIQISLTGSITSLKSASSQATPGDVIEFMSGTYPSQVVYTKMNGTYDRPIIIRSALNAKVIFQTITNENVLFQLTNSSNILVEGPFIVRNGVGHTVTVKNCTNVTFSNFKIYNSTNWAMYASGTNVTLKNNFADGCVLEDENCTQSNWMQCFVTGAIDAKVPILSSNIYIENNEIMNSWGEGIDIIMCTSCIVRNNYLHDNKWVNIYVDNAHNTIIENNIITYKSLYKCSRRETTHAIGIGNEDWPPKFISTTNITIRNNLIWGSTFGIGYWGWSDVAYYSDIVITNNNFIHISLAAINFNSDCLVKGKTKNNQFKNNFIHTNYTWYAVFINDTQYNTWNISDNVYLSNFEKLKPDTWNGSDGNAHSKQFRLNETSFNFFFDGGVFKNCTNDSYYQWDVKPYCFVPHKESILYHNGVYVGYSDLDGKMETDYFECMRNKMKPSIGLSEGMYACSLNATEKLFISVVILFVILFM